MDITQIMQALSQAGLKDPQLQMEIIQKAMGGQMPPASPMPSAPAIHNAPMPQGQPPMAGPPGMPVMGPLTTAAPQPAGPDLGVIPPDSKLGQAILNLHKPAPPRQQHRAAPARKPVMSESDRLNQQELQRIQARKLMSGSGSVFGEVY